MSFIALGVVVFVFIFVPGAIGQTARGPLRPEGVAMADADVPPPVKVMVGKSGMPPFRVAALASYAEKPKSATATFTINYLNAGEANYYGDVSVGWPADAKSAFADAANAWGALINSSVPIVISASWADLGAGGVLGYAGARSFYKDFTGAPQAGTYYSVAAANACFGSDLNGSSTEEIVVGFNAQFTDWYYGTDGAVPANKIDLVQVVMHEIGHGLGFLGSMSVSGGLGSWGLDGIPIIYDRYAENGSGQPLLDTTLFPNGSVALANQLISAGVYFNGANAVAGNGGSKVQLYAPNAWADGSSYSHLGESFNGTANALMTYSVDFGEAVHNPGPVTLGLMKDVGWSTAPVDPVGPVIMANGSTNAITINSSNILSITVQLNPGNLAGTPVDWWVIAHAGSFWYYLNSATQWTQFDGNLSNCDPVYQGELFDLPVTEVLNTPGLVNGLYTFWFAVDYPMDGILNVNGPILYDSANVAVQ